MACLLLHTKPGFSPVVNVETNLFLHGLWSWSMMMMILNHHAFLFPIADSKEHITMI